MSRMSNDREEPHQHVIEEFREKICNLLQPLVEIVEHERDLNDWNDCVNQLLRATESFILTALQEAEKRGRERAINFIERCFDETPTEAMCLGTDAVERRYIDDVIQGARSLPEEQK